MPVTHSAVMATYKDSEPLVVRQCNTQAFSRLFGAVARSCALEDAELEALSKMFSAKANFPAPLVSAWPELAVTFWMFPPSDEAWYATHRFLLKTLRPRVQPALRRTLRSTASRQKSRHCASRQEKTKQQRRVWKPLQINWRSCGKKHVQRRRILALRFAESRTA